MKKGKCEMKIRRTVKESAFGFPLKEAGKVEIIDEDRMRLFIRLSGTLSYARNPPHRNPEECWEWFVGAGKCETFASVFEIVQP